MDRDAGEKEDSAAVLLRGRDLGWRQGGRWVLRHVDVTVEEGRIITLIGPNGAGKTTTLKLLLGLLPPSEGRVWRRPGLKIGYVPQQLEITPSLPLTVDRFMGLGRPCPPAARRAALRRTGALHCLERQMRELSGGERQRVMLARAIAGRPDLLVLDEPVQGVDHAGEIALYRLIGALRDELGCAVLLVSHDLHLVMAATDRVICLNGHVCCAGAPERVAGDPVFRQLFGDGAAQALALYRHRHDHRHLADGRVVCDEAGEAMGKGDDG